MIATPPPARTRMTNAEYLALPETDQRTELANGEIITLPTPTVDHQKVSMKLSQYLGPLLPNGELYAAPLEIVFEEGEIPQPDVFWIAENSKCVVIENKLYGPPDLIIEILSPSTEARDRGDKFALYQKHGVREYWLVNPEAQFVEVYTHKDGAFARVGLFAAGEHAEFTSPLLEKPIALASIFK